MFSKTIGGNMPLIHCSITVPATNSFTKEELVKVIVDWNNNQELMRLLGVVQEAFEICEADKVDSEQSGFLHQVICRPIWVFISLVPIGGMMDDTGWISELMFSLAKEIKIKLELKARPQYSMYRTVS